MSKKVLYSLVFVFLIFISNMVISTDNAKALVFDFTNFQNGSGNGQIDGSTYGTDQSKKCEHRDDMYAVTYDGGEICYKGPTGIYCAMDGSNDVSLAEYFNLDEDLLDEKIFTKCVGVLKNEKEYDRSAVDEGLLGIPIAIPKKNDNEKNYSDETFKVDLITSTDDEVAVTNGIWWGSIVLCYTAHAPNIADYITGDNNSYNGYIFGFTDRMFAEYSGGKGNHKGINFLQDIERSNCRTYSAINIPLSNIRYVCMQILVRENEIEELSNAYKNDHKVGYINEYKNKVSEIESLCMLALQSSDYNDGCVQKCLNFSKTVSEWDKKFGINGKNSKCGFSMRIISLIMNIAKWIKFLIPVAVIILGMLDFLKATGSEKDEEIKKAQGNFIKRLIAAALIFLVPLLFEFVLPKLGFDYNSCGIF